MYHVSHVMVLPVKFELITRALCQCAKTYSDHVYIGKTVIGKKKKHVQMYMLTVTNITALAVVFVIKTNNYYEVSTAVCHLSFLLSLFSCKDSVCLDFVSDICVNMHVLFFSCMKFFK